MDMGGLCRSSKYPIAIFVRKLVNSNFPKKMEVFLQFNSLALSLNLRAVSKAAPLRAELERRSQKWKCSPGPGPEDCAVRYGLGLQETGRAGTLGSGLITSSPRFYNTLCILHCTHSAFLSQNKGLFSN